MMPIRVCLLNDHLGWGGTTLHGVSRYFLNTIPRFNQTRIHPVLAILKPRDALGDAFESVDIPVHFLGGRKGGPGDALRLLSFLRRQKIDLIHAQGYAGTTLARALKPVTGARVVLHSHEADDRYPHWLHWPDRLLAPLTDHAFANGTDSLEFFARTRAVPRSRTQLLHNGIDLAATRPASEDDMAALRRELEIESDAQTVLTLTRFSPEKGNHVLVEAIPKVLKQRPNTVVLFAGNGPELEACQNRVDALGIAQAVRFLGYRKDAHALLGLADVAVIPSLREGTCYALLESLALGVPTVASNVGGLAEVLVDGDNGRLVPAEDPTALAEGLSDVLGQPALAARLAAGGLIRVRDFDVRTHVDHLTAVYSALIEGTRVPEAPA